LRLGIELSLARKFSCRRDRIGAALKNPGAFGKVRQSRLIAVENSQGCAATPDPVIARKHSTTDASIAQREACHA
jgi:hypothetical protein